MKQELTYSVPGLLSFSTVSLNGARLLGVTTGIMQNTEAAILADRIALVVARNNYEAGKLELATRRIALADKTDEARVRATVVRDLLKPRFGASYSNAYQAIGLEGSMEMPRNAADLGPVLEAIKGFLAGNPTMQNADLNITPEAIQALMEDLTTAQTAVVTQDAEVKRLLGLRDDAAKALYRRLRGLFNELDQLLDPLDVRWLEFGFNLPGAQESPDAPQGLQAMLIGPTAVALRWDATPRAEYYRVFKKVTGLDEQFVAVGSPADLDFTIEGLPAGATVEIQITAVNNGGESARTEAVTVVMRA